MIAKLRTHFYRIMKKQHTNHHEDHGGKPQDHSQHKGNSPATHTMPDGTAMHGGGHAGHDHKAMIADFLKRFWVSLILSTP